MTRAVALALLLAACRPLPAPQTPEPAEGDLDMCGTACDNMWRLRCPAWQDSPEAPCEAVCRNAESEGVHTMHPECVARAGSCAEADLCFEVEP